METAKPKQQQLRMSVDGRTLELYITGDSDNMAALLLDFGKKYLPNGRMLSLMYQVQEELKAPKLTLWCRIKRMGPSGGKSGVDAGYIVPGSVDWQVADLVMPPSADQDALREQSSGRHLPDSFGCSILPNDPERSLSFNVTAKTPQKCLLHAFLFFKAMGFMKPEELVVQELDKLSATQLNIRVFLGTKGLTRIAMGFEDRHKVNPARLAQLLHNHYNNLLVDQASRLLNKSVDVLSYAVEKHGYSVTVGFIV